MYLYLHLHYCYFFFLQRERHKGVEHLIEIQNPNLVAPKMKKVSELEIDDSRPQLTRRQR